MGEFNFLLLGIEGDSTAEPATESGFGSQLVNIIGYVGIAAGAFFVLWAVYLGFIMMTASSQDKRAKAKSRIFHAVSGILIIVALVGMLQAVKVNISTVTQGEDKVPQYNGDDAGDGGGTNEYTLTNPKIGVKLSDGWYQSVADLPLTVKKASGAAVTDASISFILSSANQDRGWRLRGSGINAALYLSKISIAPINSVTVTCTITIDKVTEMVVFTITVVVEGENGEIVVQSLTPGIMYTYPVSPSGYGSSTEQLKLAYLNSQGGDVVIFKVANGYYGWILEGDRIYYRSTTAPARNKVVIDYEIRRNNEIVASGTKEIQVVST